MSEVAHRNLDPYRRLKELMIASSGPVRERKKFDHQSVQTTVEIIVKTPVALAIAVVLWYPFPFIADVRYKESGAGAAADPGRDTGAARGDSAGMLTMINDTRDKSSI